ncbi:hypothetical protein AB0442_36805 [Kitasatospora sp. NPDC085895]|uniref:hypothetical protein n=1 Tax=Kitasatospora sp. NPDC085895 TaxID=3155057 RepID=UPI00344B3E24
MDRRVDGSASRVDHRIEVMIMTGRHAKSHPTMEEGQASRMEGAHHGWSGDIDEEKQEPNDSAHRSFDPDTYAPEPGPGQEHAAEEDDPPPGDTVTSEGRRAEKTAESPSSSKHHHDKGPQGPSGRPSGGRNAGTRTGVDPQESDSPAAGH